MAKIVVASNNRKKLLEVERFLGGICDRDENGEPFEIVSLADIGYTADIVEDGDTFEANALIKARTVAALGYIGVADDSGLCVDALNGDPGVYSARYAGGHDDVENNIKILKNLENIPWEDRTAHFVSVIACVFPDGTELIARGECPGRMLFDYRGNGGFGYDPLFLYEPMDKTFAEMNSEEKDAISHRANAMKRFAVIFGEELEKRKVK
ncbi:MAG: RdgB/HAM1 family non-canonical purine NTP pyrophosphatase [Clostridia bacterium]|nr:RdgB/HAM1 family non-canonical purine NTP pyrophosphatase [Clostridia bacterium]